MDALGFLKLMKEQMSMMEIEQSLLSRSLNEGFSGGEKKRNEIFQMAMLEPKLSILDETDSGLDIDALRIVANGVNKLRSKNNATIARTQQLIAEGLLPVNDTDTQDKLNEFSQTSWLGIAFGSITWFFGLFKKLLINCCDFYQYHSNHSNHLNHSRYSNYSNIKIIR